MNLVGGRVILVKGLQYAPAMTMNLKAGAASLRARAYWKIQGPAHVKVFNVARDIILMERTQ